ncbi:MAG: non-canonical purine NTP pyrophosphatase [Alistipes shahii]
MIDRETGHEGFGYDPPFVPDGYAKTFAEMTTEEKKRRFAPRPRLYASWPNSIHSIEK